MPVDETLSRFSDWSYNTATLIYVLAMVFFAVEQAFGRAGRLRAERTAARKHELVGASAGGAVDATARTPAPISTPAGSAEPPLSPSARRSTSRAARFGRMGVSLTVLGALLHLAALVLRGLATSRVPWGNMYEYVMAVCLIAVVTWLVVLRKYPSVRHLSAFVLLPVVILLFVGGTMLYATAAPVQPALQSYWLIVHVAAAIVSSGMFLVPGVASVLYLMRDSHESNSSRFAKLAGHLPGRDLLDRLSYRTTVLAFPIYTFGVVCGAIWAEAAWGRFWGWDPKETVAFVAWVVYAAYLHARATAGWRGRPAAWINVTGFALIVFNLFFINLVTTGLHSYAGVG
ncbi:c-type cytochrome biogenesis protein CcsB [Haloechinothrix halophila]|uniref:Cytochrome c-type biogenesis protein CcsB n=1 Tax=Haloechinothrix halophila YIM 93223 TaxID=592678 RepID=W9DM56_9PSEU|nr:c-type cytochrome biogenesis protein CcsB [Haloechinothrix halophila]ETA66504.1 cytochrome c-type biogenesis protein CcsB [Haloechinothrix halophila YIM 93223]